MDDLKRKKAVRKMARKKARLQLITFMSLVTLPFVFAIYAFSNGGVRLSPTSVFDLASYTVLFVGGFWILKWKWQALQVVICLLGIKLIILLGLFLMGEPLEMVALPFVFQLLWLGSLLYGANERLFAAKGDIRGALAFDFEDKLEMF